MNSPSAPMQIPFHVPFIAEGAAEAIAAALGAGKLAGGGVNTKACEAFLSGQLDGAHVLLTHSCTAALEAAALLLDLKPGDEVIMPSFTFSSTANAFALRGAMPVFVDVRGDTLNIDERLIGPAITQRTKAICVVHYAGVPAEMDAIAEIARRHGLAVVEDAAQAIGSSYCGRPAGTLGDIACFSVHDTKNIGCGEGGALVVRDAELARRAAILAEKGTNRTAFLRGEVDKYTWLEIGMSLLPGEIEAAMLHHQLQALDAVTSQRLALWGRYAAGLDPLRSVLKLPQLPQHIGHNGHIFAVRLPDEAGRADLSHYLADEGIGTARHYVPLHSAPAGQAVGRVAGPMSETDAAGAGLLRLPLHSAMTEAGVDTVVERVKAYFMR